MINYFKAAERLLINRTQLERSLENLTRRQAVLLARDKPTEAAAVDLSRPFVSSSFTTDALSSLLDLVEVNNEIARTNEIISDIDSVLSQLEDQDAGILRAWYIEQLPKEAIAEQFSFSSRTSVYDLRNKAVAAFALLYFGGGALAST